MLLTFLQISKLFDMIKLNLLCPSLPPTPKEKNDQVELTMNPQQINQDFVRMYSFSPFYIIQNHNLCYLLN